MRTALLVILSTWWTYPDDRNHILILGVGPLGWLYCLHFQVISFTPHQPADLFLRAPPLPHRHLYILRDSTILHIFSTRLCSNVHHVNMLLLISIIGYFSNVNPLRVYIVNVNCCDLVDFY